MRKFFFGVFLIGVMAFGLLGQQTSPPPTYIQFQRMTPMTPAPPGCTTGDLYFDSSTNTYTPCGSGAFPAPKSVAFLGIDPWADVTAYGARLVASLPQTTATISSGSFTASLASASSFQNGDGVTITGAGPSHSLATPSAPTITPSIAAGGTSTGIVKNSATASSTYNYLVVGRTAQGGLTAAGATGTITNGQAALGLQTATLTTCSRSNDSVTCNTSANNGLVVGALVHVYGTSNADFDGWFTVSTINSSTQFVLSGLGIDSRGVGWLYQDSNSTSGGSASYYLSNHLSWSYGTGVWEYYVCAKRPGDGSFSLIGQTKPSANGWQDAQFDDYGSPFMDGQTYPSYVTNSLCTSVSALPNPLTTTISSGAGTTTLTLANSASNSVSSQAVVFDDAPGILAAANFANFAYGPQYTGGMIYFPPATVSGTRGSYYINSYLSIPGTLAIKQAGPLILNETFQLGQSTIWDGSWTDTGGPQFALSGGAAVTVQNANPGIYTTGSFFSTSYITFNGSATNGGTLWVGQDVGSAEWDYVNFVGAGVANSDYLSMDVVLRSTSSGGNNFHWRKTLFSGGPNQIVDKSWTPLVFFPPNQNGSGGQLGNQNNFARFLECFFNRRGVEEEAAGGGHAIKEFNGGYRQGGITPFLILGNSSGGASGQITFSHLEQDTETVSSLAMLGGATGVMVSADTLNNASLDGNGVPPPFTGFRPFQVSVNKSYTGKVTNRGASLFANHCIVAYPYDTSGTFACSNQGILDILEPMHFPGQHTLYWDMLAPTNISATVAAGGSLALGTYQYSVSAVDAVNGETVMQTTPSSAVTTTSGNQTVNLTWTGSTGASSYNVYRCSSSCALSDGRVGAGGQWRQIALHNVSTSLSDTGLGVGTTPPSATSAGLTTVNRAGITTQSLTASTVAAGTLGGIGAAPIAGSPVFASGSAAADLAFGRVKSIGTAPTCAFTSGGGTGPSCALQTGSTDSIGTILLTTGTTPGSSGTFTLTFSNTMGTNPVTCVMVPSDAATAWNARATIFDATPGTSSDLQNWDNNGVSLTASVVYRVGYWCGAK